MNNQPKDLLNFDFDNDFQNNIGDWFRDTFQSSQKKAEKELAQQQKEILNQQSQILNQYLDKQYLNKKNTDNTMTFVYVFLGLIVLSLVGYLIYKNK